MCKSRSSGKQMPRGIYTQAFIGRTEWRGSGGGGRGAGRSVRLNPAGEGEEDAGHPEGPREGPAAESLP